MGLLISHTVIAKFKGRPRKHIARKAITLGELEKHWNQDGHFYTKHYQKVSAAKASEPCLSHE